MIDYATLLAYDEESPSGLRWVQDRNSTCKAGMPAGTLRKDGYWRVKVCGKGVLAHKIVYLLKYGDIPEGLVVDHRDTNKSNNVYTNLRVATNSQNNFNRGQRSDNTSGVKGVTWMRRLNKWQAQCMVEGKQNYLGVYEDKCDAIEAVDNFRRDFHKEFANKG